VVGIEVAVSASVSSGISTRIRPLASCAPTRSSRSPSISAVSIARAETAVRLEATEDGLIEASSTSVLRPGRPHVRGVEQPASLTYSRQ
jgi:hypothetical protein